MRFTQLSRDAFKRFKLSLTCMICYIDIGYLFTIISVINTEYKPSIAPTFRSDLVALKSFADLSITSLLIAAFGYHISIDANGQLGSPLTKKGTSSSHQSIYNEESGAEDTSDDLIAKPNRSNSSSSNTSIITPMSTPLPSSLLTAARDSNSGIGIFVQVTIHHRSTSIPKPCPVALQQWHEDTAIGHIWPRSLSNHAPSYHTILYVL
jgi:hypothetical protein